MVVALQEHGMKDCEVQTVATADGGARKTAVDACLRAMMVRETLTFACPGPAIPDTGFRIRGGVPVTPYCLLSVAIVLDVDPVLRYSREVKDEVFEKIRGGQRVAEVARVHGINEMTVRTWLERDTVGGAEDGHWSYFAVVQRIPRHRKNLRL